MNRLTEVANRNGTDKGTIVGWSGERGHGFTEFYEPYVRKFYNKHPRILEIGSAFGESASMWNEYFDYDCDIVCFDIDIEQFDKRRLRDNITLIQGDQNKDLYKIKGKFDIIIDDGLHSIDSQFKTLYELYNKCTGIYILEDLHTNVDDRNLFWGSEYEEPTPFYTNTPLYFLSFLTHFGGMFNGTCLSNEQIDELKKHISNITIHSRSNPDTDHYLYNQNRSITSIIEFI